MIDWLASLKVTQPVAHGMALLCLVAALGLLLGSLKLRGVGLGIAGVLFVGILFGHFSANIDPAVRAFLQEFGLILFVYTTGMQLGPGFAASLRQHGLTLNLLAAAVVVGGAVLALLAGFVLRFDIAAVAGLFAGATTNTPALGAAEQALATLPMGSGDRAALPGLAYAVSYPAGIAGIITSILLLRAWCKIDLAAEAQAFAAAQKKDVEPLERLNLVLENPNLDGLPLADLPGEREFGVVISRVKPAGAAESQTARDNYAVRLGDVLLAVGTRRNLERFRQVVGRVAEVDLTTSPSRATHRRIVVTRKDVLGKTIEELGLETRHEVKVTRVSRADLEMTAVDSLRIQFGDLLEVVGEKEALEKAATTLGNSVKALNETQFVPLFLGIALGVLGGILPITVPGLPVPVRLGMAGGPLILAILLSRAGHIGRLVWHMPPNANLAFRELGITLFLACVGLKAGEKFFATVLSAQGPLWLASAMVITIVPLFAVGLFARRVLRLNFMTISGVLAGSTTDPPALAFAVGIGKSDAPSVAYATVYPTTMLLRILAVQTLVVVFG